MFNNLKIYTRLSLVIGVFAMTLMGVTAFTTYNTYINNLNFKRILVAATNSDQMRDAAYNISAAQANIGDMMMMVMRGETVSPETEMLTKNVLKMSLDAVDDYMASPFNNDQEQRAAAEVNSAFNDLYTAVQANLDAVHSSREYRHTPANLQSLRSALREKINQFSLIADQHSDEAVATAEADYNAMMVLGCTVVVIALVMLFMVRFWLRRALVKRMDMTIDVLKRVGSGDLSNVIEHGNRDEIGAMLAELEAMRASLSSTIFSIREGVVRMHTNSQEIAQGNNDLSSRTEEQAAALQQTAASMEQIKTTVRQNADNAYAARQLAESASSNAQQGGEAMQNLEQIMVQITDSSRQIADINGVIDSIANQTNILALNAAVEAARAGEQGRGFAVVAEEVRNLAKRSAEAAKEINTLINTCVSNMDSGSRQVNQASVVMQDIVTSVAQVRQIMGEITSASDEQSAGINQISQAVNEMDLVTQQNAAMVEEAAMAAGELEAHSDELEKLVAQFALGEHVTHQHDLLPMKMHAPRLHAKPDNNHAQWETF
ncbi:methyl-accepting chemotaxis protein [Pantoea sp. NPDC088449]|uniref:methyl-accepting chemotaxis protein n=1 Tax=Pantoea sp. NPDC088449 TaxID=3364392 RepID=UPI0037FC5592